LAILVSECLTPGWLGIGPRCRFPGASTNPPLLDLAADADFAAIEPRPDPLRPSNPSVFACTVPTTRPICSATATTRCSTASLELCDDRGFAVFASEPFGLLLLVLLRFAMRALLAHPVPQAALAHALLRSRT
jgi:hypothetical protein